MKRRRRGNKTRRSKKRSQKAKNSKINSYRLARGGIRL